MSKIEKLSKAVFLIFSIVGAFYITAGASRISLELISQFNSSIPIAGVALITVFGLFCNVVFNYSRTLEKIKPEYYEKLNKLGSRIIISMFLIMLGSIMYVLYVFSKDISNFDKIFIFPKIVEISREVRNATPAYGEYIQFNRLIGTAIISLLFTSGIFMFLYQTILLVIYIFELTFEKPIEKLVDMNSKFIANLEKKYEKNSEDKKDNSFLQESHNESYEEKVN